MGRRLQNPSPLAVVAGLAALGVGGYLAYEHLADKPKRKSKKQQEREPELPLLTKINQQRNRMRQQYPEAKCLQKGWARAYSVTGPEDGFALEWEAYERSGGVVLIYDYISPSGIGYGVLPFYTDAELLDTVNELKQRGFDAWNERQDLRGRPPIPVSTSVGSYGC